MSLHELEAAVERLPNAELAAFKRWFEAYLADEWDRRIEADILAGRLEAAGRKADADFEAGRCTPLGVISLPRSSGSAIALFCRRCAN